MGDDGARAVTETPICWPANSPVGALNDAGYSIKTKVFLQVKFKKPEENQDFLWFCFFVFIEEPASFSAPTGGSAGQQMGVFVPAPAPPSPNYLSKGQLISKNILSYSSKNFGKNWHQLRYNLKLLTFKAESIESKWKRRKEVLEEFTKGKVSNWDWVESNPLDLEGCIFGGTMAGLLI